MQAGRREEEDDGGQGREGVRGGWVGGWVAVLGLPACYLGDDDQGLQLGQVEQLGRGLP